MIFEGALVSAAVSAIIPAATDWISAIVNRFTGGAGALPKNVDELIKIRLSEIEHLKALVDLDKPYGEISSWVADLRAAFRPCIAIFSFIGAIIVNFIPEISTDARDYVFMIASSTTAYLYGERMYMGLKGFGKNK